MKSIRITAESRRRVLMTGIVWIFLPLMLLGSLGCARSPDDSYHSISLTGDFATPFQIQVDNFVRRQPPAVYVSASAPLDHKPRGMFVPLRMMQQLSNNAVTFSDLLSRQVWQVWLGQGAFQTLEFAPNAGPFEVNRALALARRQGAEVLVGGYINHFMDGGTGGESSLSLTIEVYDVKTGNMIWQISQAGIMEKQNKHDFYLFTINERNPGDPSGLITRSLAWDMGKVIQRWVDPYAGRNSKSSVWDKISGNQAF